MARLQAEAADLADLVVEERLKLADAIAALKQRQAEAEAVGLKLHDVVKFDAEKACRSVITAKLLRSRRLRPAIWRRKARVWQAIAGGAGWAQVSTQRS